MNHATKARLGDHGRLVIPSEIRKQLKLNNGDSLEIGIEDGKIVIVTPQALLEAFFSSTRNTRESPADPVQDLMDERRLEASAE